VRHFRARKKPIAAIGEGISLLEREPRQHLTVEDNMLLAASLEDLPAFTEALLCLAHGDRVLLTAR
jgi:hypothetical protein